MFRTEDFHAGRDHRGRQAAARHLAFRRRSRIYVGLENADALAVIDTATNTVVGNVPIGQAPQAIVYVPNAVPEGGGLQGLQKLGLAGEAAHSRCGRWRG